MKTKIILGPPGTGKTEYLLRKVEAQLHKQYKEHNTHGEWFNLTEVQTQDIIKYLDTL